MLSTTRTTATLAFVGRPSLARWRPVLLALPLTGLGLLLIRPELNVEWHHHPSHFWLVLTAAAVSVVLAYVTNIAAGRHRGGGVTLVSLAFLASAGFLGLHALATPGILIDAERRIYDRDPGRPDHRVARAAVAGFARHHRLPTGEIDKLVFATHEAVTNALMHGRPPTLLRLWAQPDRVTVTVTDTGPGPSDPLVGLLPPEPLNDPGPGPRLGLWLTHQLVDVAHRHDPDGYTIRLAASHPLDHTD